MVREATGEEMSLVDVATKSQVSNCLAPEATAMHSSPVSPPPFMVGMAEIELDRETGVVEVLNYASVVDCGIPINPALARIQAEGGIVQGIGHTLMEDVTRTPKGRIRESNLFTYRLPTRLDTGRIRVEFENSYEPTGPFGAKSIGEIVINTPAPRDYAGNLPRDGRMASRAAHSARAYRARETRGVGILSEFLHIPRKTTAIIGSGGKSTLLRALAEELATGGAANAEFVAAEIATDKPQVGKSPNEDRRRRSPQTISRRLMAASRQPGAPPQKRTPSPKRRTAHT